MVVPTSRFGFLTFADETIAEKAKSKFDGHEVDSFNISLTYAHDRPRGGSVAGGRGAGGRGGTRGRGSKDGGHGRGGGRGTRGGRGRGGGHGGRSGYGGRGGHGREGGSIKGGGKTPSSKVKGTIQAFQGTKLKFGGDSD